jgi:hypothetical protein
VLLNSLTAILDYAFRGCTNLKVIILPASLRTIGYGAFNGCTRITQIALPDSLEMLLPGVFEGCTGLTHVVVPKETKTLPSEMFMGCTGLTRVILPEQLVVIESHAFMECARLAQVTLPAHITDIQYRAFEGCTAMTQLSLPKSLQTINDWAFTGCTSLTAILAACKLHARTLCDAFPSVLKNLTFFTAPCLDMDVGADVFRLHIFAPNLKFASRCLCTVYKAGGIRNASAPEPLTLAEEQFWSIKYHTACVIATAPVHASLLMMLRVCACTDPALPDELVVEVMTFVRLC